MTTTESTPIPSPDHAATFPTELAAFARGAVVIQSPIAVGWNTEATTTELGFGVGHGLVPLLASTTPFRHDDV